MVQEEKHKFQEKRRLTTLALRKAILKNDSKEISEWVELADKYECSRPLRLRGWQLTADYRAGQGNQIETIIAFNSARQCSLDNRRSLTGLFDGLSAFFNANRSDFSKHDLELLLDPLQRITEFYKIRKLWDSPPVRFGRRIAQEIERQKELAPDKIEGPATHKAERIVSALSQNVTKEEVRADFARLIAPVFREIIAKEEAVEEEAKNKKSKKKSQSKKDETEKKK